MKKVAIVGVEGSGKTVMLAGLGDLYTYPDEEGYFLVPKNFSTAAYVAEKIDRMRKGEWPAATAGDEMRGLDWTLKQNIPVEGRRPEAICEVSFLDFAGEVYRTAFGIGVGDPSLTEMAEELKRYVSEADELIVLINLRDVIVRGVRDSRVQEAKWITKSILDTALSGKSGRKTPRTAIALSQADSYEDTIKAYGGAKGVLKKFLPYVAYDYGWLDVFAVNAVDKTKLDEKGNVVPATEFTAKGLVPILTWIIDGFAKSSDEENLPYLGDGFLTIEDQIVARNVRIDRFCVTSALMMGTWIDPDSYEKVYFCYSKRERNELKLQLQVKCPDYLKCVHVTFRQVKKDVAAHVDWGAFTSSEHDIGYDFESEYSMANDRHDVPVATAADGDGYGVFKLQYSVLPSLNPEAMPVTVYDKGNNGPWLGIGKMGNFGALQIDLQFRKRFYHSPYMKVEYSAPDKWAGICWQDPPGDWGERIGGKNLQNAKVLEFSACGEIGGEEVSISIGMLDDKEVFDSAKYNLRKIVLKKDWELYRFDLEHLDLDLSRIKTPFVIVIEGQGRPVRVYFGGIFYKSK